MPTVLLLGTLDTKGEELRWLRTRIEAAGCGVHLVDVGTTPSTDGGDTTNEEVARRGGADLRELREAGDRGRALRAMAAGAAEVVRQAHERGTIDGLLAVGGSGGSSIAAEAMRALPVGVPKLLVSTMASGDVGPLVGENDVTLMYSVVDVAGLNRISRTVLANAAGAITGMVLRAPLEEAGEDRPMVAATMFGVTTPAVTAATARLEQLGYEPIVFHATGSGGRSMEALTAAGYFAGVLDLTTTELADELVGGVLSAGPDRLTAAGRAGVPQVVSLGALDMVNFGPRDSVPGRFEERLLYEHNATVTLMRTTAEENAELGRTLAEKAAAATGPTVVLVPLRGVSAIDADGQPFRDEAADAALIGAVRDGLVGTAVQLVEADAHINDEGFAVDAADRLHALIGGRGGEPAA